MAFFSTYLSNFKTFGGNVYIYISFPERAVHTVGCNKCLTNLTFRSHLQVRDPRFCPSIHVSRVLCLDRKFKGS